MGLLDDVPDRIQPYITMTALNEAIEIATGSFQLVLPDASRGTIDGHLRFRWLPSAAMEFEGGYSGPAIDLLEQKGLRLESKELGLNVPVWVLSAQPFSPFPQKTSGVFQRAATVSSADKVDQVRFCLVNFPGYIGLPIGYRSDVSEGLFRGRLEMSSRELLCRVDAIRELEKLCRAASRDAGFVISHVGELKPLWGTFSPKTVEESLDMLHLFFGFLRGAWSGPIFPQGFTSDQKTWEQLASWRLSETRELSTWLPQASPLELNQLFAGFLEKCSDSSWQSPLRTVVGWYVQANSTAALNETKLIIAQVALELIAWVEIVERRRLHSRSDFDKLSAAGRIRSLLHHLGIPTAVPSHYPELTNLQEGDAFDGPGILVRLRNALVHATESKRVLTSSVSGLTLWEAGQLALQYVELAVLALCGYQGKYARRAWRGWKGDDEVVVPWATNERANGTPDS